MPEYSSQSTAQWLKYRIVQYEAEEEKCCLSLQVAFIDRFILYGLSTLRKLFKTRNYFWIVIFFLVGYNNGSVIYVTLIRVYLDVRKGGFITFPRIFARM